jgi:hypothetical protein
VVRRADGMFDGQLPPVDGEHVIPRGEDEWHDYSPHCICNPGHVSGYIRARGYVNGWIHHSMRVPDYPPAA